MTNPSNPVPLPGEVSRGARIFTIQSLAGQASSAVHELISDAKQDLVELAKQVIRTTPDKKAPVMRFGMSFVVDLRTGGAEVELRVARRTVYRSEVVLEQMQLPL